MDDQEAKLDEVWSDLDSESRERAVALFLEMAYRFVSNRREQPDESVDENSNKSSPDRLEPPGMK